MLSRQGKGSTYKGKQGELEFLNYGAHDGGGGGDGGSPKVATTLMGARTGEDWGWLIAATKMNLANPAQPTPQFFDIGSRQPSDRVIGYL